MSRSEISALIQPPLTSLPPLSRLLVQLALTLARWDGRLRSRRALGRLDTHLLRDIGLTDRHAACECVKPFWRS